MSNPKTATRRGATARSLRSRLLPSFTACLAAVALVAIPNAAATGLSGVPVATTSPGSPGVAQAPDVIYDEDFENGDPAVPVLLDSYVGASGATYDADLVWREACNGWISAGMQPTSSPDADAQITHCGDVDSWNAIQQLAQAFGLANGQSASAALGNHAVSAYTNNMPGVGATQFETVTPIPLSASNRFLAFSVDVAAMNCPPVAVAPLLQFYLIDATSTAIPAGTQVDACVGTSVTVPALGVRSATVVDVGTYASNGSVLFSGSSVGVRLENNQGSGGGNDHSFDNLRILDVTPQLDNAFAPAAITPGGVSTLTFTVTNTSELASKNGWSFSHSLPAGLRIAGPTPASTTCPSGVVTATVGGTTVSASGNLSQGMVSCTITVRVTSNTEGTYTSGPSNVTPTGINLPATTSLSIRQELPTLAATGSSVPLLAGSIGAAVLALAGLALLIVRRRTAR